LYSEECLGKNPKGFLTQRVALEEEDQLRWVGEFSSHALFLQSVRLPGPSLACDPTRSLHVGWRDFSTDRLFGFVFVFCMQTAFGSGGRVSLDRRTGDGRIVEVVARVA